MGDNLSFEDRHAAFIAGMDYGHTEGRAEIETEMDAAWAPAYQAVQKAARTPVFTERQAAIKARQEAACLRNQAAAVPWPDEDPNPSARALNGWPDP